VVFKPRSTDAGSGGDDVRSTGQPHECQLTPIDLAKCQHELGEIIKHNEDQVLFVDLGPTAGRGERVITALGQPYTPLNAPCIVV